MDSSGLKEGCACCSGGGVPDGPDEVVSALSTGKNAADGHAHGGGHMHPHAGFSLPDTPVEIGLGVVMGGFAVAGFYVGWKNFKQAWDTSRVLGDKHSGKIAENKAKERAAKWSVARASVLHPRGAVAANPASLSRSASFPDSASHFRGDAGSAHKIARLQHQSMKNLRAHGDNLQGSASMQRFIQVFSGVMVMGSAALVAGGVFIPLLAVVGTGVQMIYCAAHIGRYLGWELGRTRQEARLKDTQGAGALARRGAEIMTARQQHRAAVFIGTSRCFFAYGVGAALLTANAVLGVGMALLVPGLALFLAGMLAVLVLNNRQIIGTFFNNSEEYLEREGLGTQAAQLCRLGHFTAERTRLDGLTHELREAGLIADGKAERWCWTQASQHRVRTAALTPAPKGAMPAQRPATSLAQDASLTPVQDASLTPVQDASLTPVQDASLTLVQDAAGFVAADLLPSVERHRRRALVSFMAQSAVERQTFVEEMLAATRAERVKYAARFGHLASIPPELDSAGPVAASSPSPSVRAPGASVAASVVRENLDALESRSAALERQEAVLSQHVQPNLRAAQAIAQGPSDADFFALLWMHLGTLDDGMPNRCCDDGTPDAQEHLDRVVVEVAEAVAEADVKAKAKADAEAKATSSQKTHPNAEQNAKYEAKYKSKDGAEGKVQHLGEPQPVVAAPQGAVDPWWHAIAGGRSLDPQALRQAMENGDARAKACVEAFSQSAQLYLLYTYPAVLGQQTGSLVDHLSSRIKHSQARAKSAAPYASGLSSRGKHSQGWAMPAKT